MLSRPHALAFSLVQHSMDLSATEEPEIPNSTVTAMTVTTVNGLPIYLG